MRARSSCRRRSIPKASRFATRSSCIRPGGIAGGDELDLALDVAAGAHALLTTPGAAKWYRSAGPWARQRVAIKVAQGAALEWLPQETIIFDGAAARISIEVRLARDARYLGWEIVCLGRTGSGERFTRGAVIPRPNCIARSGSFSASAEGSTAAARCWSHRRARGQAGIRNPLRFVSGVPPITSRHAASQPAQGTAQLRFSPAF
jgi:hypothetical protein